MYLKRLELYGFKSFAAKTGFEFGHGVTAIVGPNGSGKSNVADALRWVLGEQSGRLIRSKKLEDVIYTGSAKRQRSEKAEVAMVFDNSDAWLPLDSEEVTISRRVTRNGDSDYYINGKKVRLREIQTLFMKANVTQSSYAIIGQGLVESVLNLRPEDRRQLIEEAADIQRYRLKIEEAEERLEATHENIQRVKLLMKEIAPRMGQLERQARRAGDHARLSADLLDALRTYYEHQWHRAQEALTVARAAHDQAQAETTQARVALETCQRELDDITKQLEEQRQASAAVGAERDRLDQRVRELERRLAVATERRAILEARRRELADEVAVLEHEKDRAEGLLGAEDGRREELAAAVTEARKLHAERTAELNALESDLRDSQGHAVDSDARGKRLQVAASETKARIARLQEAAGELEREASRLDSRRRSLVNQMAEQLRVLRGLRQQEEELLAEVAGTGDRRALLGTEVDETRGALSKIEAAQNERRGKIEGLEARLSVIEDAQKHVQPAADDVAVEIEGALASVFEILRVPRGMEDAIGAALSDTLEGFVVQNQGSAITSIQEIASRRGPRTTVIPMDVLKPVYPLNILKEKGVLGVASRLVKYPAKYEKLVNALLGRTVIVQDTAIAAKLSKRNLGTIVTMDGVVFHPSGFLTGGVPQAARPFALSYERDLETIPKEMDRVRKSLELTENEAEMVRARLRQAEAALAALSREADEALGKRLSLQDGIGQRQQKLAQLRGELRGLIGAMTSLRDQEKGHHREVERLEGEREAMLAEATQATQSAKHVTRANDVVVERRAELQTAVDQAADALARADAEFRSIAIQRETAEAALSRSVTQTAAKTTQLKGLELETKTLRESIEADEAQMKEARSQLEALVQSTQPGREGAHHLEARQRDLHSQVMSSQSRLFEAERHVLETEAEVRRWSTEVEHLQSRIAEDGLTLTGDGDVIAPVAASQRASVPYWLSSESGEDAPGGLRPMGGGAHIDPETLGRDIEQLRAQIRSLGPVNIEAQMDYETLRERHDFLAGHVNDLEGAEESLKRAIGDLTELMRKRFETTFQQVAKNFERFFTIFFGGGDAKLKLTDPKEMSTSGVEVEARPPGKRTKSLSQLSGGEKSLTAVSLLFALLEVNPAPFCVLDEVDAMLDEANVGRFAGSLRDLSQRTQFIVITHNRRTIEVADNIYGISMAPDAASRVLSMRLGDVKQLTS